MRTRRGRQEGDFCIAGAGVVLALLIVLGANGCGGDAGADGCRFKAGALPVETLPAGAPHGDQIPIDHILIVMQENRSFDHYFGRLPAFGQPDVDGLDLDTTNPDADGTPVPVFHEDAYCIEDVNHSWNGSHIQFNGGNNDGFVTTNNPGGARAMGFYDTTDLPYYYALANTFATGDRYFCSMLGPTFPNRFYLFAATSFGHIRNDLPTSPDEFSQTTIFDLLNAAGISWKLYFSDIPSLALFGPVFRANREKVVPIESYFTDVVAGQLPHVAFIEPVFFAPAFTRTDEHPPGNIQFGQKFVADVLTALMQSPAWPSSVFFLIYDEHGGFFDHVPPPSACVPDDIPPLLESGDFEAAFDRHGFRVPLIVVSPFVKPHFVSHRVNDQTSVLRFIETRFNLPALTARDANANPMLEFFDFENPAFLTPPNLPPALIDQARLDRCEADFPL